MNNTNQKIDVTVQLIKIAIDMHLRSCRVVRQLDFSAPQPAQKMTPVAFMVWLKKQLTLAERVVVCYEAGCFGYGPARRMIALGAEVLVIAPQSWDEQRKRQVNDKLDAQVMCQRLNDYLQGHRKALSVVRIPSEEEEALRTESRMREQLCRERRSMQAKGRSLLLLKEIMVSGRWWRGTTWISICQQADPQTLQRLEDWKELIEVVEGKLKKYEERIEKAAPEKELIIGEGKLSHQLFWRELIDPNRFKNSRQVGNYFGLCPSEASSGESRRLGSITKHGNPRLRRVVVEMAWRMFFYQKGYTGLKKWLPVLADVKASSGIRKKAIVAVARRLAVDLWRIATGRCTAESLGFTLKTPEQLSPAL